MTTWLKSLLAVILLTVGNFAYAQDVQRRSGAAGPDRHRAPRQSAVLPGRVPAESRGLAFPLLATGAPVRLEAELRLDGKVIMSEQLVARADVRVVHLFAQGAGHFGALRDQDARNPGRVQLRILLDGKPVFDSSLTEFDAKYPTDPATSGPRPRNVATKSACSDNCDLYYQDCISWCDPRGNECANCNDQYNNCMASCPTCNDWVEVSRTRIGREWTGSSSYFGVSYCHYKEYYLVEQANAAGCYPNRTVCDTDTDTIFEGFNWGTPGESRCCQANDPEFYCGGDITTC
ncbi:MAG TPA: hypothetical protein VGX68_17850 [Thermoanaerobaculia bacterium]|jgi:hypothetical protein|nr:hypothetical protein [Thermoanaerobaculia bacterium]